MDSFRDVIDSWPSKAALGAALGLPTPHIQKMRDRDSIAAKHWLALLADAQKRSIRIDAVRLVELAARKAT